MALGILLILFIVISVVSIGGLLLLYLVKNPKIKNATFYIMSVWGMAVAVLSATSYPSNFILHRLIAWAFGFLSLIGLILHLKAPRFVTAAYVLITVSVAGGVLKLFLF